MQKKKISMLSMADRDQGPTAGRPERRLGDYGAERAPDLQQWQNQVRKGRNILGRKDQGKQTQETKQTQCRLCETRDRVKNKKRDLGRNLIPCDLILLFWLTWPAKDD